MLSCRTRSTRKILILQDIPILPCTTSRQYVSSLIRSQSCPSYHTTFGSHLYNNFDDYTIPIPRLILRRTVLCQANLIKSRVTGYSFRSLQGTRSLICAEKSPPSLVLEVLPMYIRTQIRETSSTSDESSHNFPVCVYLDMVFPFPSNLFSSSITSSFRLGDDVRIFGLRISIISNKLHTRA